MARVAGEKVEEVLVVAQAVVTRRGVAAACGAGCGLGRQEVL